jgi:uncharacterized protein
MKIVLAGSSGFLGSALRRTLAADGHELVQLVRGRPRHPGQRGWDPYAGRLDPALLTGTDAVVNLAGVPIGQVPWTAAHRRQVVESRVVTTTCLAEAIASNGGTTALVNASGINYYGVERGQEELEEDSAPGTGFLADVCKRWESATAPAADAGARVALLRTAIVLDRSGGSFKLLVLPFRLGLGGRVGSGTQYFPTISLADYVAAVSRIVTDEAMRGPYNLTAPEPATNAQFTKELGRQLRRPTLVPVPGLALTTVVGDVGRAMVGSIRAIPRRLMDAGFQFAHPTVADQVAEALR